MHSTTLTFDLDLDLDLDMTRNILYALRPRLWPRYVKKCTRWPLTLTLTLTCQGHYASVDSISSYLPICNRFYTIRANNGKMTSF